jgi:hypothetical protein
VYLCVVNTTEAKHTQLASQTGVRQLPRGYTLDTVISSLNGAGRNRISDLCTSFGIPYISSETIEQFIGRVIGSGAFELGAIDVSTQFSGLPPGQQQKIQSMFNKWGIPYSSTDTVRQIVDKFRPVSWNPRSCHVEEF